MTWPNLPSYHYKSSTLWTVYVGFRGPEACYQIETESMTIAIARAVCIYGYSRRKLETPKVYGVHQLMPDNDWLTHYNCIEGTLPDRLYVW